ncbi:MAG: DUF3427 domain-containing protein [Clostridiaceae bacterium]
MLKPGLYEQVINKDLDKKLKEETSLKSVTEKIDKAEASRVLSRYLTDVIEKTLEAENHGEDPVKNQIRIVNKVVETLTNEESVAFDAEKDAKQLLGLISDVEDPLGKNKIVRPETSVAFSSLFTGSLSEPSMESEIKKEIVSADRIDMLVSFVKWSGLRLIYEDLKEFTQNGGNLRVITTTYMGATDSKALEELLKLPNTSVRMSYDTKRTRLHAKTYVFHRDSGFTVAYVGSSNLSKAAISSGLEWNMKVTKKELPDTLRKIEASFESYWNSKEFEAVSIVDIPEIKTRLKEERYSNSDGFNSIFDVYPYPYQEEILEKLQAERDIHGHFKNLVVAATGTGKTLISAFDYKRFVKENPMSKNRLLFIAHREEILKQSLYSFRAVLKDQNFGELFVGEHVPEKADHLFMSIQTFNSQNWTDRTSSDFYDYIVVDEFHHAVAKSYIKLLKHYKPSVLLGLTATPERMDGQDILTFFDDRVAASIRLPEAIERRLLSPFQYFGVSDEIDLNDIKWSRGGYDRTELSNIYTLSGLIAEKRTGHIVNSLYKYVTDIEDVKGLGFCVSIEHAKYMAEAFNEKGIPSICLTGNSEKDVRATAKEKLVKGEIKFIFTVDLFNEGVDIPEVNTVLFLRPTESLTVFLQQLGRGLRLSDGKDCLTVLDFIGAANKRYNFADKFKALLSNTHKGIEKELKDGFDSVPKGCFIQLEKKAQKIVLDNIRASYSNRKISMIERIRSFTEDTGKELTLNNFMEHYDLDFRDIYKWDSFSELEYKADMIERKTYLDDSEFERKALLRLSSIDSLKWIDFLLDILTYEEQSGVRLQDNDLTELDLKYLDMFIFTVWNEKAEKLGFKERMDAIYLINEYPIFSEELIAMLKICKDRISVKTLPPKVNYLCPLEVHSTYSRDQILVGLGYPKTPSSVREGVTYLRDIKTDVFFVTLNKAEKDYSPMTMYEDYSIDAETFHWQSQHSTSDTSPTGLRYINHRKEGSKIMLFVREYKKEGEFTSPYTFLGLCNYVSHTGSKPMSIIFKLEDPIPAKYIRKTNQLVI